MTQLTVQQTEPEWMKKLEIVRKTLAADATPDDFQVFIYQAKKTGLDPLARQIYLVTRNASDGRGGWTKKSTIQASIDGMRLVAERSGKYCGQTEAQWCGEDGVWVNVWLKKSPPAAARIGVYHADFKEPLFAVARFDAYAQKTKEGKLTRMWETMGDVMSAKCAEMLALRKAFPQDLSGIYGTEEMQQADTEQKPVVRVEAAHVIDEKAQAAAGEEDQRPAEEKKIEKPVPTQKSSALNGFENDLKKCQTIGEVNELFSTFKDFAKGQSDTVTQGWNLRIKRVAEIRALKS